MLPEIEKKVFEKIDFSNRLLKIRRKFVDDGLDTPIFKKDEILHIFKKINETCKYTNGGSYMIHRLKGDYRLECNFIVSKNSINIYYHIFNKGDSSINGNQT